MSSPGRLAADEIVLSRAGRKVLDGVSLSVLPGEIVTIEGPSGCGKTTLLRAMATLIDVDSGTLMLEGVDARTIAPRDYRTRVAYVPQQPPMFDGTVGDNVSTGPQLRDVTITAEAVDALLTRAGLDPALRTRPARELSVGEKQRVAIARALANAPCALLLDEPTAALDPASAKHILALILALAAEGLAVIVVTHDAGDATALSATHYVCQAGKLRPKNGAT